MQRIALNVGERAEMNVKGARSITLIKAFRLVLRLTPLDLLSSLAYVCCLVNKLDLIWL